MNLNHNIYMVTLFCNMFKSTLMIQSVYTKAISPFSVLLCHVSDIFCYIHAGLQITVGHRTMANQILPMSDEISTVVGHNVRTIFWGAFQCKHYCSKYKLVYSALTMH